MKIISHRGNTFGPNPENENKPEVIDYCVREGYEVEIDLWFHNGNLYLGHDEPTYRVSIDYLLSLRDKLWIHCKNLEVSVELYRHNGLNYFFNDNDNYALTSERYIWTHPRNQKVFSWNQVLLDFRPKVEFEKYKLLGVHGVCVDYVD